PHLRRRLLPHRVELIDVDPRADLAPGQIDEQQHVLGPLVLELQLGPSSSDRLVLNVSGGGAGPEPLGPAGGGWGWDFARHRGRPPDQPTAEAEAEPIREALLHERLVEVARQDYAARPQLDRELLGYATGYDDRVAVVVGPAGSGKTAALANL